MAVFCVCTSLWHLAVAQWLENLCGVDNALLAPANRPSSIMEQALFAAISGFYDRCVEELSVIKGQVRRGAMFAGNQKQEVVDNSDCCETSTKCSRTDRFTSLSIWEAHCMHYELSENKPR